MFYNGHGVGIITSQNFKFVNKHTQATVMAIPEERAHCIQYQGKFYCTISMDPKYLGNIQYKVVELISITKEEYDEYIALQESEQIPQIVYPEPELEPTSQPELQPQPEPTIQKMTIQQMRDKIIEQEEQIQMLTECILELSEVIYEQ